MADEYPPLERRKRKKPRLEVPTLSPAVSAKPILKLGEMGIEKTSPAPQKGLPIEKWNPRQFHDGVIPYERNFAPSTERTGRRMPDGTEIPHTRLEATHYSDVYHRSSRSQKEYMKAPIIHVGTLDQAASLIPPPQPQDPRTDEGMTRYKISKHASIFPRVVSDEVVNLAHANNFEDMGLSPSGNVTHALYGGSKETVVNHWASQVSDALKANQIIPYVNYHEKSKNAMSYAVPSPWMNLSRHDKPDPLSQPPLPMDYSGMAVSEKSAKQKVDNAKKWKKKSK